MCAVSSSEPVRVLPNGNYRRRRVNQIALDYYKIYIIIRLFIVRANRCKFSTRSLVRIGRRISNAKFRRTLFTLLSIRLGTNLCETINIQGPQKHGVVSTVLVNRDAIAHFRYEFANPTTSSLFSQALRVFLRLFSK